MDKHLFSNPIPAFPKPAAWSSAANSSRPLSDIREQTEPSLVEVINRKPLPEGSIIRHRSFSRKFYRHPTQAPTADRIQGDARVRASHSQSPSNCGERSSIFEVPTGSVPARESSQHRRTLSLSRDQQQMPAVSTIASTVPAQALGSIVPNRGRSQSPVKEIAARLDPVTSEGHCRTLSKTYRKVPQPNSIVEFPFHHHPRIRLEIHLAASLFVGGGSIEGFVRIIIDDAERLRHKRALAIARVSIDLMGIEEMTGSKKAVFLNLTTELVDSENPPPHNMVESLKQISPVDPFWYLAPSTSSIPFLLALPLDVGPPPFESKHARIRYMLSATILIRDQGRQYLVRTSQNVAVLSVYDPEKALMSLPSPLTASDEYVRGKDSGIEIIRLTAGLHRQVWVSGTNLFVDTHIANGSRKKIKRLELQLERDILCYKHSAASTLEKSASQARIFDTNDKSIVSKVVFKQGNEGWNGVEERSSETRTCDLALPRDHATVKCGKHFEVRFFLNILVSSTRKKLVTVQLPIVLIHMNSLDVIPNSVAQVAAAIEEKRAIHDSRAACHKRNHSRSYSQSSPRRSPLLTRRPSQTNSVTIQGRAFAAPRMQSLDRLRAQTEDLQELSHALDTSPRKDTTNSVRGTPRAQELRRVQSTWDYRTPPSNRRGRVLEGLGEDVENVKRRLRAMRSAETMLTTQTGRTQGAHSLAGHASTKSHSIGTARGRASVLGMRDAFANTDGANLSSTDGDDEDDDELDENQDLRGKKKKKMKKPKTGAASSITTTSIRQRRSSSLQSRIDRGRERQWQFRKKMSSSREGWKGVAWLMAERDKDKMNSNWI